MPSPIQNVVVLMLENRSFDNVLGFLRPQSPDFDGLTGDERLPANPAHQGAGALPPVQVVRSKGSAVYVTHPDPGHEVDHVTIQLFGRHDPAKDAVPTNDGFLHQYSQVQVRGEPIGHDRAKSLLECFDTKAQLPVLATLAEHFMVFDRWFSSVPGPTWPNRFFAHCATSGGHTHNPETVAEFAGIANGRYPMRSIFDQLSDAGISWGVYFHDIPQSLALANLQEFRGNFRRMSAFRKAAAEGLLPAYSFIEPRYMSTFLTGKSNDMHPDHDVRLGEALVAEVYNALRSNEALWRRSALLIVWDEHGGFYDHVPPPPAVIPDTPSVENKLFQFDRLGVRVPAILVSPWVDRGVDHTPYEHASIPATLQRLFRLDEPLTFRDAEANTFDTQLRRATPRADAPAPFAAKEAAPAREAAFSARESVARDPRELSNFEQSLLGFARPLPVDGEPTRESATVEEPVFRVARYLESGTDTSVPAVAERARGGRESGGGRETSQVATAVAALAPREGWPDAAIGPNARTTTSHGMRRVPLSGIATVGNQERAAHTATRESAASRAVVWLPEVLDPAAPVDVLLHLHGFNIGYRRRRVEATVRDVAVDRIGEQVAASNRPMIAVLPQGTTRSGFGARGLDADAYLESVWQALVAAGALVRAPTIRRTILSGHSGAGSPLAEMLRGARGGRVPAALESVLLFDAINSRTQREAVQAWLLRRLDLALAGMSGSNEPVAFRAYHTDTAFYRPTHRELGKALDAWFASNASALGGAGSPRYARWRELCQVVPTRHQNHDGLLGKDGRLRTGLTVSRAPTPEHARPARSMRESAAAPNYAELVPVPDGINAGLTPCRQSTMLALLGRPGELTENCSAVTSARVKALIVESDVGPFKVRGLRPAVDALTRVMDRVRESEPALYALITSAGMLCCRRVRRAKHLPPSPNFSNHSWGTAIDLKIAAKLDRVGDGRVQRGLVVLAPYFQKEGFYWGAGFKGGAEDGMHFEASNELVQEWAAKGLLKAP